MDVGIYPLAMTSAVFGLDIQEIASVAQVRNGVDEQNAFTFQYADGKTAVMASSLTGRMDNALVINGEMGRVIIGEGDWWRASRATLVSGGDDIFSFAGIEDEFYRPYKSTGFQFEIEAVQNHIRAGLKEAPEMPLLESLQITRMMDSLRSKWNVRFEQDEV